MRTSRAAEGKWWVSPTKPTVKIEPWRSRPVPAVPAEAPPRRGDAQSRDLYGLNRTSADFFEQIIRKSDDAP